MILSNYRILGSGGGKLRGRRRALTTAILFSISMISRIRGVESRSIMHMKFRTKSEKVKTFLEFGLNNEMANPGTGREIKEFNRLSV
jgi:hypothetical protein